MNVSGTLKNKTIDFYREKMISFDHSSFETSEVTIGYDGKLSFAPWDTDKLQILEKRQNEYINNGIERTEQLINEKNFISFRKDVLETINLINKSSKNISYALYECLYKIIRLAKNSYELNYNLKRFKILIDELNNKDEIITQCDLEIILDLFMKNLSFTKDDIINEKIKKLKIDERNINDESIYKIYKLGEFIAPNRLPSIAQSLYFSYEFTNFIVPIYLALKDEVQAKKFLYFCKKHDMDFEKIEKNAMLCRVPNNLIDMVRR